MGHLLHHNSCWISFRQQMKNSVYRSRQSLNSPSPGETEMDLLVTRERPRRGIRNSGYDVSVCWAGVDASLPQKARVTAPQRVPVCHIWRVLRCPAMFRFTFALCWGRGGCEWQGRRWLFICFPLLQSKLLGIRECDHDF